MRKLSEVFDVGEELKKIIDDPNLSNEEIAKRVRETLNKNSEQVVEDKRGTYF